MSEEGEPFVGISEELNAEFLSVNAGFGCNSDDDLHIDKDYSDSEEDGQSDGEELDSVVNLDFSTEDEQESKTIDRFFKSTCCSLGPEKSTCWKQFSRAMVTNTRQKSLELSRNELDLVILANIQAGRVAEMPWQDSASNSTAKRIVINYKYSGKSICRSMFCFLYAVSLKRLKNLIKHYSTEGLTTRVHKLSQRKPHNQTSYEVANRVKDFIEFFADNHALPLPGRLPSHKDYRVMLLPTDMTKMYVYNQYIKVCEKEHFDGFMSRWTFQRIWNELCPYVSVMKPATDLCFTCQQNAGLLMRSANLSEEVKSHRLQEAQQHLTQAKLQRQHYNDQCSLAKLSLESSPSAPAYMHYSFDFAQQVHFPSSPQQPGQLFFRTPRKCGIFGVCCESVSSQVNYLIDEADSVGKGANVIISLVHNYLEIHGMKEKHLMLHAHNCVGQNKNNAFIQYIAWRVLTNRNSSAQLSFMLVGHTKFAPDRFFGLFKRQFRKATVDTLQDISRVMTESSKAGKNIPVPTVDFFGKRNCEWYEWSTFLSQYFRTIPGITKYHHFLVSQEDPGVIVCKELADSPEVQINDSKH